jgi:hypothetical protein
MKIAEALASAEFILTDEFDPTNFHNIAGTADVIWTLLHSKKTNVQEIGEKVRTKANAYHAVLNPEGAKYGPVFLSIAESIEKYGE